MSLSDSLRAAATLVKQKFGKLVSLHVLSLILTVHQETSFLFEAFDWPRSLRNDFLARTYTDIVIHRI